MHLSTRKTATKSRTIRASRAWDATCGNSRSTNGRSFGTCCEAICRWWAPARRSRRGRAISNMAAPPAAHAPGLTCLWAVSGRDNLDSRPGCAWTCSTSITGRWRWIGKSFCAPFPRRHRAWSELRKQKTEDRRQKAEDRSREGGEACICYLHKTSRTCPARYRALRDGHFEYPSGLHSNEYLQFRWPCATTARPHAERGVEPSAARECGDPRDHPELSVVTSANAGLP